MTQPPDATSAADQPGALPAPPAEGLVEPEGVDAGSAEMVREGSAGPAQPPERAQQPTSREASQPST